jgi:hypothetical protein
MAGSVKALLRLYYGRHWYMTSLEPVDMRPFVGGGSAFIYKETAVPQGGVGSRSPGGGGGGNRLENGPS